MAESLLRWRFSQTASVSFKYFMLALKIIAGKLICALDYNEFSFCKK